jgi:NADPH-dependent 2,4-dienoyl-CoA reductase/sulfur reductase-like enzyme/rhodanese-related sulfurtransferase
MARKKIVVIGGVAAGTKAASRARRLDQEAQITIIEKGEEISYAGCGLPYYISGTVEKREELISTAVGVPRTPQFFKQVKDIDVLIRHEALKIDRENKEVEVKNLDNGKVFRLPYDKLILATGSYPFIPPVPGKDLRGVLTLKSMRDADALKEELADKKAKDVVIIGGGLIGIESTEALISVGCRVTIVELLPRILGGFLDPEMALLVEQHMESKGVRILTGEKVTRLEGEGGRVKEVVTENHSIPCDIVIMAAGMRPNVKLAREAGLKIGETGAIAVDSRLRTSDPDIFAVGDCVQNRCLVCLDDTHYYTPLGDTANKHGRVAGTNAVGGDEEFKGILSTGIFKVFEFNVGRAGFSEERARQDGFEPVTVITASPDKAHFYPTAQTVITKLIGDAKTGKLIGIQAVGPGTVDKCIDVAATAMSFGALVSDVSNLDLAYAPPYSPALANIIEASNALRNKMEGRYRGVNPLSLKKELEEDGDIHLLDVRTPAEHEEVRMPNATLIPLGNLRERIEEIPRDQRVVVFCKTSLRAYEAALVLQHRGYKDVRVLDGGLAAWPFEKITP